MSNYKQGELLSIIYDVWISGTKLEMEKKSCITSISIKETVDGSDTATIQISDPEFMYIEDDIFVEENTIMIKLGWDNTTYRVEFSGYISALDINFDSDGCPKLTLTCMDNTHIMNRTKKNNTFKNTTSAEVVKKIVQSYGYTCVVDSSYSFNVQETITQSNQTDIDFITKLAGDEVYPFTARLVGTTFYYVKKGKLETPKITLTYKKYPHEIISFTPKINKESKQIEISSSSIDTSSKSVSNTKGTVSTKSGSASANNVSNGILNATTTVLKGNSANGGYSYNPKTKSWNQRYLKS